MVGTTVPMLSVDRKNTGIVVHCRVHDSPWGNGSFERPSRGSDDGKEKLQ